MSQRHQIIPRTICLVFNEKGQILLLKFSREKGKLAGFYDPPGGHIELGEGIIANTKREVLEETGLEIEKVALRGVVHVANFFGKNLMLFVTTSQTKTVNLKSSLEGEPMWINLQDLDAIKIFDDLKAIIKQVKSLPQNTVFTARSEFDKSGKMVRWEIEV
ncbi:NUDIX domain-containing protein [Candidatus Beckwithbacteria bacterium]|nr:NUDIX domain-containing protein [Candidatus Beckwithbacteria bacterium]